MCVRVITVTMKHDEREIMCEKVCNSACQTITLVSLETARAQFRDFNLTQGRDAV